MNDLLHIPPEVQDEVSYKEYIKLKEELDRNPLRFYQTTDPAIKVDLLSAVSFVKNLIKHLSHGEVELILSKVDKFRNTHLGPITDLRMKAFGTAEKTLVQTQQENLEGHKQILIDLFKKHYTLEEVWRFVITDIGMKSILKADVERFYKKYIDVIVGLKEEYRNDIQGVRLTHKRSRLEELSWIYQILKEKYLETESIQITKELRATLKDIKGEVEGDIVINGKIGLEIEVSLKEKIEQEFFKEFNVTFLVLTRLAAKRGINPSILMGRLAQSYYAKFSGFRRPDEDKNLDEIYYPSTEVYDFDEIKKLHNEKQKTLEYTGYEEIESHPSSTFWGEKLLASLSEMERQQKKNIDNSDVT